MTESLPDINEKMEAYIALLRDPRIPQEKRNAFLDTLGFKNDKARFKFLTDAHDKWFNRSSPPPKIIKR